MGNLGKRKERAKHMALDEIPCSYYWLNKVEHRHKKYIQEEKNQQKKRSRWMTS